MKTFKEQLEIANRAVFINLREFGERMVFDGVEIIAVKEDLLRSRLGDNDTQGIMGSDLVIHVILADLAKMPMPDEVVTIDGKKYSIKGVTGHDVLKIELQKVGAKNANQGRYPQR